MWGQDLWIDTKKILFHGIIVIKEKDRTAVERLRPYIDEIERKEYKNIPEDLMGIFREAVPVTPMPVKGSKYKYILLWDGRHRFIIHHVLGLKIKIKINNRNPPKIKRHVVKVLLRESMGKSSTEKYAKKLRQLKKKKRL